MKCKNNFQILTVEEEIRYALEQCENCIFYDKCELINDYLVKRLQKRESAVTAKPMRRPAGKAKLARTVVIEAEHRVIGYDRTGADLPFYMRETWKDGGCHMKHFNQIECGSQWVSDGVGDDFKIDLVRDTKDYLTRQFKIDESSHKGSYKTDKWEPRQPVFISAPTGGGKNTFVERDLPDYIRKLNHRYKTDYRILMFSNRRALTEQSIDRLENGVTEDDTIYYNYKDYVDVMPYHSVLNKVEYLERVQQGKSKYLYVVCDEAHFFASDSAFNPDTERILEAITNIFQDAIRIYMSATLYEVIPHIREKEFRSRSNNQYIPGVMYHFERDYWYLDAKYFSDEKTELVDIIIDSAGSGNEKWLVFIDNKKQGAAFKSLLECRDGVDTALKGKAMVVDADSKYKDKQYQEMIVSERFVKGVNVVIATSVIDNGVNFWDVDNVVITDINQTKCLQMVGRVRVNKHPVTKAPLSKVTLYIKRHNEKVLSKRLKAMGVQQDAYHDFDMAAEATHFKLEFLTKYKDAEEADWENSKHWFGRDKREPDKQYLNGIARALANTHGRVYQSILEEMVATDKGKVVTGQRYLEYQLSWFGKSYSKKNDITISGYKTGGHVKFEKWLQDEWLDKRIPRESLKDFGKAFFATYYPIFGFCTKKQGFSSDDNRTEKGPKNAGYSINRIREILQVRKMPFEIIEDSGSFLIVRV